METQSDLLDELGLTFLGSRLKRLADRFQAEAGEVLRAANMPIQPSQQLVMAALHKAGPLSVGDIALRLRVSQPTVTRCAGTLEELGLIAARRSADQRQKILSLTAKGRSLMKRAEHELWPRVARATEGLCRDLPGDLLESLAKLEAGLDRMSLNARVEASMREDAGVRVCDFRDDLADAFFRINAEWIEAMFAMEASDRAMLSNPRAAVIDKGGVILFAESGDLGMVGTCALIPEEDGWWELGKMGVLEAARGRKVGEFLLAASLARAKAIGIEKLFLLTSHRCEAAIHLYEKFGFRHDAEIMRRFGSHYARCDVTMSKHLKA